MTARYTVEQLLAAAPRRPIFRADPTLPGWVSNGHWAAKVGDDRGLAITLDIEGGGLASTVAEAKANNQRTPLVERVELRIPNERRLVERVVDQKDGCPGCVCGTCTGVESTKTKVDDEVLVYGQSIFVDPFERPVIVNPDFRPLLDGLNVAVIGSWPHEPDDYKPQNLICGFDAENELTVIICRLVARPRKPGEPGVEISDHE